MYTSNTESTSSPSCSRAAPLSTHERAVLCALYELGQQGDGQAVTTLRISRLAGVSAAGVEGALVQLERRGLVWAARARLTLSGLAVAARLASGRSRARHAA